MKQNRDIQYLGEHRLAFVPQKITTELDRSSVAIFLAEVINRCLHEDYVNEEYFNFCERTLHFLDIGERIAELPIYFVIQTSKYLGFGPDLQLFDQGMELSLNSGEFSNSIQVDQGVLNSEETLIFANLLGMDFDQLNTFKLEKGNRKKLLDKALLFLVNQLELKRGFKSHEILEAVFQDV